MALASGHQVAGVLTTPGEARGSSAWRLARDEGIELHDPAALGEAAFADRIVSAGIDLLINVHSLHIADAAVVEAPRLGGFNLHPGPLPDYRGLNAPSWAIYDGRDRHAVTLHWMTPEVDCGPIAYESRFEIGPSDTGLRVSSRCVSLGIGLIERLLEDAVNGRIPRGAQADRHTVWHGREAPNGGWVDWHEPAWRIAALIRAADFHPLPSPWGRVKTGLAGKQIELVEAEAVDRQPPAAEAITGEPGQVTARSGTAVEVETGSGRLSVRRLRIGGETVAAADRLEPGDRLGRSGRGAGSERG